MELFSFHYKDVWLNYVVTNRLYIKHRIPLSLHLFSHCSKCETTCWHIHDYNISFPNSSLVSPLHSKCYLFHLLTIYQRWTVVNKTHHYFNKSYRLYSHPVSLAIIITVLRLACAREDPQVTPVAQAAGVAPLVRSVCKCVETPGFSDCLKCGVTTSSRVVEVLHEWALNLFVLSKKKKPTGVCYTVFHKWRVTTQVRR